jgi:hypothetical protein
MSQMTKSTKYLFVSIATFGLCQGALFVVANALLGNLVEAHGPWGALMVVLALTLVIAIVIEFQEINLSFRLNIWSNFFLFTGMSNITPLGELRDIKVMVLGMVVLVTGMVCGMNAAAEYQNQRDDANRDEFPDSIAILLLFPWNVPLVVGLLAYGHTFLAELCFVIWLAYMIVAGREAEPREGRPQEPKWFRARWWAGRYCA